MVTTVHDQLRARLLAGVQDGPAPSLEEIGRVQRCPEFERLRHNRMVMGYYRYQQIGTVPAYDSIGSAIKRLRLYLDTGNKEHLLDAANLCEVEWQFPGSHPEPWFGPTDDGVHAERR
jgi:hypothetical protein